MTIELALVFVNHKKVFLFLIAISKYNLVGYQDYTKGKLTKLCFG